MNIHTTTLPCDVLPNQYMLIRTALASTECFYDFHYVTESIVIHPVLIECTSQCVPFFSEAKSKCSWWSSIHTWGPWRSHSTPSDAGWHDPSPSTTHSGHASTATPSTPSTRGTPTSSGHGSLRSPSSPWSSNGTWSEEEEYPPAFQPTQVIQLG